MRLFALVFLSAQFVLAQPRWHEGVIVLRDNQVKSGTLSFQGDVLVIKSQDETTVYPSHKVSSFRFYDQKENINRQYVSVANTDFIYPVFHFYELVTKGTISVVRKNNYPSLSITPEEKYYSYYSLRQNELIPLRKFRSHIFPDLLNHLPIQLHEFVTRQNLNPNRMADAIQIVQFYNRQIQADISIAGL